MEDFDIREELGKGSFGLVAKVVRKSDGEVYAMKQVSSHNNLDQVAKIKGKGQEECPQLN